jgi:hypothetical protein
MFWLQRLTWTTTLLALVLLVGILLAIEGGTRWAARERRRHPGVEPRGIGAVDSAVFALLGLLLAFSFSGATSRFDARRELLVSEANAIGTSYLRVDLLPREAQTRLRPLYRSYVASRLATYSRPADADFVAREYQRDLELQGEIWKTSVAALEGGSPAAMTLVVSSLNEMFDITTTRMAVTRMHPPLIIYALLCLLCVVAAFLMGYGQPTGPRAWLHWSAFAVVMALTVFLIVDIEFPRLGFVRVDASDDLLRDVLKSMK